MLAPGPCGAWQATVSENAKVQATTVRDATAVDQGADAVDAGAAASTHSNLTQDSALHCGLDQRRAGATAWLTWPNALCVHAQEKQGGGGREAERVRPMYLVSVETGEVRADAMVHNKFGAGC